LTGKAGWCLFFLSSRLLVELKGSAEDRPAGTRMTIGWPPERTTLLLET